MKRFTNILKTRNLLHRAINLHSRQLTRQLTNQSSLTSQLTNQSSLTSQLTKAKIIYHDYNDVDLADDVINFSNSYGISGFKRRELNTVQVIKYNGHHNDYYNLFDDHNGHLAYEQLTFHNNILYYKTSVLPDQVYNQIRVMYTDNKPISYQWNIYRFIINNEGQKNITTTSKSGLFNSSNPYEC